MSGPAYTLGLLGPVAVDTVQAGQLTGVVPIANGGTAAITAAAALINLFPSQSGIRGSFAVTDGTNVVWGGNGTTFTSYAEEFTAVANAQYAGVSPVNSGTSSGVSAGVGTANRMGIARMQTGTDTTGRCALQGMPAGILFGGGVFTLTTIVQSPASLSDGTDTYTLYSGFSDSVTGDATDGIYFRYTHSANSGRWVCVTRNNSTESVINTSSAVAVNTWYRFDIVVNAGATSVEFFIDGVSQGSLTTNIPSSAGRETGLLPVSIIKSAGTNDRIFSIDYYKYSLFFTTPR